jgi:hypothetical protein
VVGSERVHLAHKRVDRAYFASPYPLAIYIAASGFDDLKDCNLSFFKNQTNTRAYAVVDGIC